MKNGVFLGLDTSNYTTSLAILSEDGELVANLKRMLPVKAGERGLRQSDAVFSHIKNLPALFKDAGTYIDGKQIIAIGVSDKPRRKEGSYMPCFLVGYDHALAISFATGAPLYTFSHQEGHIMAALFSSGNTDLANRNFAALHVSGGTTELVDVTPAGVGFNCEIIGGTKDLNAGQLVDRIGVAMGFSFPAGKEMEAAALTNTKHIPKRSISVKDTWINISGLENAAMKLYSESRDKALTAAFVFDSIARAISKISENCLNTYGNKHLVYAGGVMSNTIIRGQLEAQFDCSFAAPDMSSDNAVGVAYLAFKSYLSEKGE